MSVPSPHREIERLLARPQLTAQVEAVEKLRRLPLADALTLLASQMRRERLRRQRLERAAFYGGLTLVCVLATLLATSGLTRATAALTLALVLLLPLALIAWASGRATPPGWRNARAAVGDALDRLDDAALCGPLLDVLGALEEAPARWSISLGRRTLAKLIELLPRMDEATASALNAEQRARLRWLLERFRHRTEVCIAILLALGTAKDTESVPDARRLILSHPSERVRAAAKECLIALGGRQ